MDLVRVSAVVHSQVAKHAVETDVGQIRGFFYPGLCSSLSLSVFVYVGHGRNGTASANTVEASNRGRAGCWRLRDEGGTTSMQTAKRVGYAPTAVIASKCSGAGARYGRGLGAGWRGFGVEQDRLGHGGRLILGDDDAAVARIIEVDLGERTIVTAAGRQRSGVQWIGLAIGMVEGVGVGIEQVSRVALLGRRVEDCDGRRMWVRRARARTRAFAAAEEVTDHVCGLQQMGEPWRVRRARRSMATVGASANLEHQRLCEVRVRVK